MAAHAIVPDGATIQGFLGERNTKDITAPDGTVFRDLDAEDDATKAAAGLYRVVHSTAGEQTEPYVRYVRQKRTHNVLSDTVEAVTTGEWPTLDELKRRLVDELLNEADRAYPRVSLIVTPTEGALLVDEIREANRQGNPKSEDFPLIADLVGRVDGVDDFATAISTATQFIINYKSNLASVRRIMFDRRKAILAATTHREAVDARMG